ncbi:MAG TPA: glycoside hydrolase family 2 TIM barrel-domain containing protein [Flavobacterium sp.]|nr:glycoside hydrolase family 2 TIM barrel-domain containing protein [Flavobacterium sp.]
MKKAFRFILLSICMFFLASFYKADKETVRKTISLNGNWNFSIDSLSLGESNHWEIIGLPKNTSRIVSVPHVWNVEKGLENYAGNCWYEREFEVPESDLQKTVRIQFDAVYHDAVVYINGKKAGEHIGSGYNRFFINISPFVKKGKNTLRVRVNNDFSRNNIPFLKSYDWANDGGIYRNVSLIITDPQAVKNIKVVGTPNGSKGTAAINVSFIDNSKIDFSKLKLMARITEENQTTNKVIFNSELKGKLEKDDFKTLLNFEKINPWHFDAPNLHKLTLQLFVDGKLKDEYTTVFGFRSIKVEKNRYVLNGEPIRLMGVEWMPGSNMERGMAETTADFERNLKLMKNANCIFTRFHWQQDEAVFDWCDRNGILVQEEIPYWGGATMLNDSLLALGKKHLDEMTVNHYNHPSIISWGIGNELESHNPENVNRLKTLYNEAKTIDASRLVNFVSNKLHKGKPIQKDYVPDTSGEFDMLMFNEYYSTWFGKSLDVIGSELDRISAEYHNKPMTISEWGLCEPAHNGGDPRRIKEMAQQLKIYGSKDYVAGAIYFCLNDYRTHMGEDFTYAYPLRVHGVCDIFSNPKPSYYALKKESSPVIIKSVEVKNGTATITLSGKTTIPSYTLRNYTIVCGNQKITIDKLEPGKEKTFKIKANANQFSILRPTGFEVINYKF